MHHRFQDEEEREKRSTGFSLLELLIVIAIIGALVALLLPNFQNQTAAAKLDSCWGNIRNINMAITLYVNQNPSAAPGGAYELTCGNGPRPFPAKVLNNAALFPDGPPVDELMPTPSTTNYNNCFNPVTGLCSRQRANNSCGGNINDHPGPGGNYSTTSAPGTIPSHTP